MKRLVFFTLVLSGVALGAGSLRAQSPENLKLGIYTRSEQNIFRYYAGRGLSDFYTQRVSSGYSAGVYVHSSLNYLFNAGASFGVSECSYSPNMKISGNYLWHVQLQLYQFNVWGELKLGSDEKKGIRFLLGGEWMYSNYRREIWAYENKDVVNWPDVRFLPRIGLSYEYPLKKRWTLMPNAGIRVATNNRTGYDYLINQFWVGAGISYRFYGD